MTRSPKIYDFKSCVPRASWSSYSGLQEALGKIMDFKEMEHEFPFVIFRPEKQDYLFRFSVPSRKFSPGTTQKVVFHLPFQTDFSETFCKWLTTNVNDLIECSGRLFNFRGPNRGVLQIQGVIKKERDVNSHNCNNLNKTSMLSAKKY